MTIPSPPDAAAWDAELARLTATPSLLQTWAWGEVQARAGWRVARLRLPGGGRATLLVRRIGGRWLAYVPRGPVPPTGEVIAELVDAARREGVARLRVEPDAPAEFGAVLRALGFTPRPDASPQQPAHTAVVELRGGEDELLASFKPKTRYNIR